MFLSLFNSFASAKCPVILGAYKTPLFGVPAFLSFKITPHLPPQAGLAANPRWLFIFPFTCWHRPRCYLLSSTGPMWLPLTCSGSTCSGSSFLTFVF